MARLELGSELVLSTGRLGLERKKETMATKKAKKKVATKREPAEVRRLKFAVAELQERDLNFQRELRAKNGELRERETELEECRKRSAQWERENDLHKHKSHALERMFQTYLRDRCAGFEEACKVTLERIAKAMRNPPAWQLECIPFPSVMVREGALVTVSADIQRLMIPVGFAVTCSGPSGGEYRGWEIETLSFGFKRFFPPGRVTLQNFLNAPPIAMEAVSPGVKVQIGVRNHDMMGDRIIAFVMYGYRLREED